MGYLLAELEGLGALPTLRTTSLSSFSPVLAPTTLSSPVLAPSVAPAPSLEPVTLSAPAPSPALSLDSAISLAPLSMPVLTTVAPDPMPTPSIEPVLTEPVVSLAPSIEPVLTEPVVSLAPAPMPTPSIEPVSTEPVVALAPAPLESAIVTPLVPELTTPEAEISGSMPSRLVGPDVVWEPVVAPPEPEPVVAPLSSSIRIPTATAPAPTPEPEVVTSATLMASPTYAPLTFDEPVLKLDTGIRITAAAPPPEPEPMPVPETAIHVPEPEPTLVAPTIVVEEVMVPMAPAPVPEVAVSVPVEQPTAEPDYVPWYIQQIRDRYEEAKMAQEMAATTEAEAPAVNLLTQSYTRPAQEPIAIDGSVDQAVAAAPEVNLSQADQAQLIEPATAPVETIQSFTDAFKVDRYVTSGQAIQQATQMLPQGQVTQSPETVIVSTRMAPEEPPVEAIVEAYQTGAPVLKIGTYMPPQMVDAPPAWAFETTEEEALPATIDIGQHAVSGYGQDSLEEQLAAQEQEQAGGDQPRYGLWFGVAALLLAAGTMVYMGTKG